jgi:hypothetical protein
MGIEAASAAAPSLLPGGARPLPDADEYLYLIGRPKLKEFLRFMRDNAIDPPNADTLAAEWEAARKHILEVEKGEAGDADHPKITTVEVESKFRPLLEEMLKDPLIRNGFNTVPTEVAFVELDRLVVYQKHIDLTFVRELQKRLGPAPSDEKVFAACLPPDHPQPPVQWSRLDKESFVFVSRSNDLRFLGAERLKPQHIRGYRHHGSPVGVVGLAVGYGSNFMNALYCENRLILNNGSHRAYALREMGITHVPCIVQHVSSRDQLELLGSSKVRRDPDLYLKQPRPSMLKDYFDPRLRRVTSTRRRVREIRVRFSISEHFVPAV